MKEVHANCNPKVPKYSLKVGPCASQILVQFLNIDWPGCFGRNLSFGAPNWVIPIGIEPLAP